ncbi:MAG: hypothetical protein M9925_02735 [Chloroflexi bacterium]|nr:hypothetical protein [Chloroflexota bacterium]MCZ7578372.1 hypothetical protein [Dehalococcoidia bacterium]
MPDYQVKIVGAFTTRRYAGKPAEWSRELKAHGGADAGHFPSGTITV